MLDISCSLGEHIELGMDELLQSQKNEKPDLLPPIELIAPPHFSDEEEPDADIAVFSVSSLGIEAITQLLLEMKGPIDAIRSGHRSCRRHDDYVDGGQARACLNMQVGFDPFPEEHMDVVIKFLCTNVKQFDYNMKVMLPETMAMVLAKVEGITYEEADEILTGRYSYNAQGFSLFLGEGIHF